MKEEIIAGTSISLADTEKNYAATMRLYDFREAKQKRSAIIDVQPILEWNERKSIRTVEGKRMFAAAQVSRLNIDWPISISSANAEILVSAIATRSRLRQLERDDDYMRRMLRLFQNNIIGHNGIMLQMKIKDAP